MAFTTQRWHNIPVLTLKSLFIDFSNGIRVWMDHAQSSEQPIILSHNFQKQFVIHWCILWIFVPSECSYIVLMATKNDYPVVQIVWYSAWKIVTVTMLTRHCISIFMSIMNYSATLWLSDWIYAHNINTYIVGPATFGVFIAQGHKGSCGRL